MLATTANDDFVNTSTGTAATGSVLTNDNNSTGAALTASLVTGPTAAQGVLVFNTDGTYTFTPAAGFTGPVEVVYSTCTSATPPVCAKATLHILVAATGLNVNDTNTGTVDVAITGNISTNDIPATSNYGTPVPDASNPTGGVITMNTNGEYSLLATNIGTYKYTVPVCPQGQTTNCPTTELVITVTYLPQGAINLVYPTLLQADSVQVKFTLVDGVGPYEVIFKNSLTNKIDTVNNLVNGSIVKLAPKKDDTRYTILKITDANNVARSIKFTKDTANLNVLKPQILLTLKADFPTKLPDNSFKTKLLMKVKNNGELDLKNVQVNADLSKVFPADMRYTLDSVRVTYGAVKLNPNYSGFGAATKSSYVTKVQNGFTIKYRTQAGLSGSDLFAEGS